MITRHWTCTPFADLIRGTAKPRAATSNGWDKWETEAKEAHPIRFWLAETGIKKIQRAIFFIPAQLENVSHYMNNRFRTKTHSLTSNLKKGNWYEFNTRILHCLFDELANHVEVECAMFYIRDDKDKMKKYNVSSYSYKFRSPEAGIAYFEEASKDVYDEDRGIAKGDPLYGKITKHAENAAEVLMLYKWWTIERPARITPEVMSGWRELYSKDPLASFKLNWTQTTDDKTTQALGHMSGIEDAYNIEDTQMLVKLIELRDSLWT